MSAYRKFRSFLLVVAILTVAYLVRTYAMEKTFSQPERISKATVSTTDNVMTSTVSSPGGSNPTISTSESGKPVYQAVSLSTTSNSRYTVQYGDSLYWISRQYGISVATLRQANQLSSDVIYPGEVLTIPGTGTTAQPASNQSLRSILQAKGLIGSASNLAIYVNKTTKKLSVFVAGQLIKSYPVQLGDNGPGDKQVSGDHKTPEGTFYVTEKSLLVPSDPYLGSRWMRLSYPNDEDANRGVQQGLIDETTKEAITTAIASGTTPPQKTNLGGGVGIHGGDQPSLGENWTWGCVGLSNHDVEDFYDFVHVGTRVFIFK